MKVRIERFKGNDIKWMEVSDSGVLFNTKDVLNVVGVVERPEGSDLSEPCIDLTSAVLISTGNREEFAVWLIDRFSGYDKEVLVRPKELDDEWSRVL